MSQPLTEIGIRRATVLTLHAARAAGTRPTAGPPFTHCTARGTAAFLWHLIDPRMSNRQMENKVCSFAYRFFKRASKHPRHPPKRERERENKQKQKTIKIIEKRTTERKNNGNKTNQRQHTRCRRTFTLLAAAACD